MSNHDSTHDESLQELIEAVINGDASDDQQRRLEELLLNDEQARDTWLNYANLHASLNRWFLASDVVADDVEMADGSVEEWRLPGSRRRGISALKARDSRHRMWRAVCVLVCLLVVVGIREWPRLRALFEPVVDGPVIVDASEGLEIQSADGSTVAMSVRHMLRPGETIVTSSDDDTVTLEYSDGTTIVLLGPAALTADVSARGGKLLDLKRGMLRADVSPQPAGSPLLITTPHTRVRVLGTKFELAADETDGTRLDLESGRVELLRGDEQPLKVEPNSIAIVPRTADPIRVSQRPAVIDSPVRESVFRGLQSLAFADDGRTLIGATRWQAVYWYEDDRMEVIPFSPHGRQGISMRHQTGSLLAYFDNKDRRLVFWDTLVRQPAGEFTNIAALRKQFGAVADRPPEWNPAASVAAISPTGDWFAIQIAREFRVWQTDQRKYAEFAHNYDGRFVSALASSPDGSQLAVAVRRGQLDVVDLETGKVTTTWPLAHQVPFALQFSSNGERLVVGLAGHVAVYDLITGDMVANFEQPGLPFLNVAISTDGEIQPTTDDPVMVQKITYWESYGSVVREITIPDQ